MNLLVQDIIKMAERQMRDAGIADCKNDAEMIFCWLKRIDRSRFFMEWGEPADDLTCENYFRAVARRCQHEPLQYITGTQAFMGIDLHVEPGVLIPRLDTEVVVEKAEAMCKARRGDLILDLCSGSGAIGIALAARIPKSKVTCVDQDAKAVALTQKNAAAAGVKINVRQGDLFEPVKRKKYNLIVTNPPYIPSGVIPTLMPEVRDYEPMQALDGGEDGLDFYRRIIAEAPDHLKKEGVLVLEIGHDQKNAVEDLLLDSGSFCAVETAQDLAGLDRVVTAQKIGK
ncbi:MAG: peptide chain release factor N(5)-glutamine methyltransferase [Eubacteriales bacterium]|nr:peptide chain release factor N(5)-glutamine methyltransferase [Eubacteriales bacterium]